MLEFLCENWSLVLFVVFGSLNSIISVLCYLKNGKFSNVNIVDKNNDGIIDEDIQKLIEYHEKVAIELKNKIQKK